MSVFETLTIIAYFLRLLLIYREQNLEDKREREKKNKKKRADIRKNNRSHSSKVSG